MKIVYNSVVVESVVLNAGLIACGEFSSITTIYFFIFMFEID